jgi:hypothetical protein
MYAINEVGFRPICPHCSQLEAFPLRYGPFSPTLLQFLPNHHLPAWKCVVGCRRDASRLASANPLTTFEQSNIRVSFLHAGALDDACEAVCPATRSGLAWFRYRCLGTTRLYHLHSAMMPSPLAERLLDPRAYAAPERPPVVLLGIRRLLAFFQMLLPSSFPLTPSVAHLQCTASCLT